MKSRDAFDMHREPDSRFITKYENYFEIYDRYLDSISGRPIKLIEIGVQHGGSLQMWKRLLPEGSSVNGIDIYPACKKYEEEGIRVFIGDQSDHKFLSSVIEKTGKVDFILDDGSHIPYHQIATFEFLFKNGLNDGGCYLVEDCHTSYWKRYGGGLRKRGSFIEYSKRIIDDINVWHMDSRPDRLPWTSTCVQSVEFFSSVVAFRRREMSAPRQVDVGDIKLLDLDAPFSGGRLGGLALWAKRNSFLQGMVRKNPTLWTMMKRLMK